MGIQPVRITCFSDVLCVWAYVSQIRLDELKAKLGDQIEFEIRFVQIFGDTTRKFETQWKDRGGISAYAEHVRGIVAEYDHVSLHPDAWTRTVPPSCVPAHLLLSAARSLQDPGTAEPYLERLAWAIRKAFFQEGADISQVNTLLSIAGEVGVPVARIQELMDSGEAHALLSQDYQLTRELAIVTSPTLLFNDGRQRLTGNVGYRVIEANIRELMSSSDAQHSWC